MSIRSARPGRRVRPSSADQHRPVQGRGGPGSDAAAGGASGGPPGAAGSANPAGLAPVPPSGFHTSSLPVRSGPASGAGSLDVLLPARSALRLAPTEAPLAAGRPATATDSPRHAHPASERTTGSSTGPRAAAAAQQNAVPGAAVRAPVLAPDMPAAPLQVVWWTRESQLPRSPARPAHSEDAASAAVTLPSSGPPTEATAGGGDEHGHPERPAGAPPRVLIVDDDEAIRQLLAMALGAAGWTVRAAATGAQALAAARDRAPDVAVLDVMLPDIDGLELLRRLRADIPGLPVLLLTARDGAADRRAGLRAGADGYVTKPFALDQVIARLRGLLPEPDRPGFSGGMLRVGDLVLEEAGREVRRGGDRIALSDTEVRLLRYLMHHPGRELSTGEILDRVWGYDFGGQSNIVALCMASLRRKIDTGRSPMIHLRAGGYLLQPADQRHP